MTSKRSRKIRGVIKSDCVRNVRNVHIRIPEDSAGLENAGSNNEVLKGYSVHFTK